MKEWIAQEFKQQSIIWLLITTFLGLLGGYISSWLNFRFKRQEIVSAAIADINKEREKSSMEAESAHRDRTRKEVIRWANPILGTAEGLDRRLNNILDRFSYPALNKNYQPDSNPEWSITYEYFMNSSLFLFGQYFSWIQMFKEELSFELFEDQKEKDEFLEKIFQVEKALSAYPPEYQCSGRDFQLFALQQRAIGELMIITRQDGSRTCMTYPEFIEKLDSVAFQRHLEPLRALLENVGPDDICRWKRLKQTQKALADLRESCKTLLNWQEKTAHPTGIKKVSPHSILTLLWGVSCKD